MLLDIFFNKRYKFIYPLGYKQNLKDGIEKVIAELEERAKKLDTYFNCGTRFDKYWVSKILTRCPDWVENFMFEIPAGKLAGTCCGELQEVLNVLGKAKNMPIHSPYEKQINDSSLRTLPKTQKGVLALSKAQKNYDLIIMPGQFGIRHKNTEVFSVYHRMEDNECGVSMKTTAIWLIDHNQILKNNYDFWINCAGDRFICGNDGFARAPFFGIIGGNKIYILTGMGKVDSVRDFYSGTNSFYVP